GAVQMAFDGVQGLSLDAQGDLVLHASGGDVVERAPVLYQDVNGVHTPVSGRFVLNGDGTVGFAVGAYDPARSLVIDPVLAYSTYLGGSGDDFGYAVAVDKNGD